MKISLFFFAIFFFAEAAELTVIGGLPGGRKSATALGMSADGSVVCGSSDVTLDLGGDSEETVNGAFVWTAESGIVLLPFPQDTPGRRRAVARSVSADGLRIVGEARNLFGKDEPVLWTRQADGSYTIQLLSPPQGSPFRANVSANLDALGISSDGSVICGRGQTTPGEFEAWRWTSETGLQGIGNLSNGPLMKPNRTSYSSAEAISGDGSRIVGFSWSDTTDSGGVIRQAFQYENAVMSGLGDLQSPVVGSEARAISRDGTTVVGSARDPEDGTVASRKAGAAPMTSLGPLPALALAVNADGSVVAGRVTTETRTEAFFWTEANGMELLSDQVGIADGYLENANAISDDGRVIVGTIIYPGENGQNEREAFLLVRDEEEQDLESLASQVDLRLLVAEDIKLSFTNPPSGVIYTLEFSPDLISPFAAQVSFRNGVREVLDPSYLGESLTLSPPSESLPLASGGFWRVKLSRP